MDNSVIVCVGGTSLGKGFFAVILWLGSNLLYVLRTQWGALIWSELEVGYSIIPSWSSQKPSEEELSFSELCYQEIK